MASVMVAHSDVGCDYLSGYLCVCLTACLPIACYLSVLMFLYQSPCLRLSIDCLITYRLYAPLFV